MSRFPTAVACLAVALATALAPVSAGAQQPQFIGPARCLNCHDHAPEKDWYSKGEQAEVVKLFPAFGKQAGHLNSQSQLEDPKAASYARAIGLKDVYDVKGACAGCHGTVFGGDINAGVSCETCHGPASAYETLHQTKGAYAKAIGAGMTDIIGKPGEWAKLCQGCHILKDDRLIKAGHRSGSDFDLSLKYKPVALHFKSKPYTPAQIADVWSGLRGRNTANAAPARAAATPPPAAPPPTAPPSAAPQPAAPQPVVSPPPPGRATTPPPSRANDAPRTSVSGGDRVAPSAPAAVVSVPPPPPPVIAAPPPQVPPPAAPALERVSLPALSPSAALASVQGRVIAALTQLLQQGARAPVRLTTHDRAVPYSGPDSALLELQHEAIALALQVLGQAPKAPGPKK